MATFAELGSCCAWPPSCGGYTEVVSARLSRSHGTIDVKGVGNFLSFVSSQQKFETDHFIALGHISVTAPCYSLVLFIYFYFFIFSVMTLFFFSFLIFYFFF